MIKWNSKADKDAKKAEKDAVIAEKKKFKGRVLSAKDRDDLLEKIAKDLGYL